MAEKDDSRPVTLHPRFDAAETRARAIEKIDRLIKLASETDPAKGAETAKGKGKRASEALTLMQLLASELVGWAVAHRAGLGFRGYESRYHQESAQVDPNVDRRRAAVMNEARHEYEAIGDDDQILAEVSGQNRRLALLNLLEANPGSFPPELIAELCEAIRAIDYGELLPLFGPVQSGRKVGYEELRLQLRALAFVEYRRVMLRTPMATRIVADAYGVDASTLASWGKRLSDDFGPAAVATARAATKQAGRADADRLVRGLSPVWGVEYDDVALRSAATRYKQVNAIRKAGAGRRKARTKTRKRRVTPR